MTSQTFTIRDNCKIARRTWKLHLSGDTSRISAPGQFVNISIPGKYLRRPISIADYDVAKEGNIILLYDVVGEGTEILSGMRCGEKLELLCELGNGFNTRIQTNQPVLLGGGIGTVPLLGLAKELVGIGKKPIVLMGFNTSADIILQTELRINGIESHVATADGSEGYSGFVTGLYQSLSKQRQEEGLPPFDYFYACGPTPMLKAVCQQIEIPGELSIDERMGCGFGACMCCTIRTASGPRRVCKDGPVFKKEELIWE